MGVVIRQVLARTRLRPAGSRPEKGVRKGITFVPQHGTRVVQPDPPAPAGEETRAAAAALAQEAPA